MGTTLIYAGRRRHLRRLLICAFYTGSHYLVTSTGDPVAFAYREMADEPMPWEALW